MKKTKILSLFLCFALLIALVLPATVVSAAVDTDNGMKISKTATANGDNTYTITLEAYATGSKIISEVTEDIPTDIVLVLDQSGSMADDIGTVSFSQYSSNQSTNALHYARRHNGGSENLYYPVGDDAYAPVSVTAEQKVSYTVITNGRNNNSINGRTSYWSNSNNLYAMVDGEYLKVTVSRTGSNGTYTYTLPNGTVIGSADGRDGNPTFTGIDGNYLFLASVDENATIYTYTYTDENGETQTIGTSTGANTTFGTTLYQRIVSTSGGGSRLNALKTAVTTFANSVKTKSAGADGILGTDDDVNHRIAVVGYASRADSNDPWINTELFIGSNQYNYNVNAKSYYGSAFQDMNTQQGQNNVFASIGALDANGATYTNYGLEMANGILDAYPLKDGEKRNRVIILFTDGYPGKNANDFNQTAADTALDQATIAKDNGISLYSVGIFSGADATSPGNKNGTNTQAANWFMQQVSSNNGTPQNPSYYLSAADADTLNDIFQQISDQIESGGSTATLSSDTVIKDIISPSFTLPEGTSAADITLETYHCTGKNGDVYTWSKNTTAMGAVATVDGDQVSVTGFDFKENYVGTITNANGTVEYRGDKLVISFTVSPKAGFLGGNNVYTNTSAGVYENADATTPVLTFDRPQVNVPIGEVTVTAEEKNVYLLDGLTAEQLKSGATIQCGGVSLDLTQSNYGLEDWQTAYVNITVDVKNSKGEVITSFDSLTEDETYSVSVTVSPKSSGEGASGTAAVSKSSDDDAVINVYKPYIIFEDSSINSGETPNYAEDNFVSASWKHGEDDAPATMGTAPVLTYTYDPEEEALTEETNVKVSVAMNVSDTNPDGDDVTQYVSFFRNGCAAENGCDFEGGSVPATNADRVNFVVHIKTFDLTITKRGTEQIDHDNANEVQSYIFHVTGPNGFAMDVVICGNGSKTIKNLPVGEYTITEDASWSWRYESQKATYSVSSSDIIQGKANVTVVNERTDPYWLNGGAYAHNVFGN